MFSSSRLGLRFLKQACVCVCVCVCVRARQRAYLWIAEGADHT